MRPPHHFADRILRKALRNPRNLRDLVAAAAGGDIACNLDFERAAYLDRELPLPDLARRETDLLCEVPWRDDARDVTTLVCVLLEHQSRPDPPMPLRMLLYAALYWDRTWREGQDVPRPGAPHGLPVVLPIVFHSGTTRWASRRSLADMIRTPDALRAFVPQWPILFWDLAEQSTDVLLASASLWLQSLAVVRAERDSETAFRAVFTETARRLEQAGDPGSIAESSCEPHGLEHSGAARHVQLLELILAWASCRRPQSERRSLLGLAARHAPAQHRDRIRTMGEKLGQTLEEWADERADQARAEGELRMCRDLLCRAVERRFGSISTELAARIEAAGDIERLRACFESLWDVESADELEL